MIQLKLPREKVAREVSVDEACALVRQHYGKDYALSLTFTDEFGNRIRPIGVAVKYRPPFSA